MALFGRPLRRLRAATEFAPTRRFALVLGACAPLWLLSGSAVGLMVAVLAFVAVVVAFVIDLATLPPRGAVELHRELPATIGVADEVEGMYRVTSRWHRALIVALFDDLPVRHLAARGFHGVRPLPPLGTLDVPFAVTGAERGDAELGSVALRVTSPLGLAARTLRYPLADRVLVAPSLAGVKRFRWMAVHHRLAAVGVRSTRIRGEGRSFSRLRDYVAGDDPRHIDWKATARRGHTITREFTVEQSQTVFVLVDAGRSMTQLSGRYPRFEYALSATLLLADVAITAGDRVGALVFDDQLRVLVPAQRGIPALHALRTALVPVQPTLAEPDYSSAFSALAKRQRKRALVVLVTDVIDERTSRGLVAHLSRGAARHLAIVVAMRNEALLGATTVGSERVSALYAGGAAEELVTERLTALQRMRDAGVVVLDVPPDAMAAAVVNQYLELKSRGAL